MFMSSETKERRLSAAAAVACVATATVLSGLQPAQAQSNTVTKVKYYTVNANTAQTLDQQMIARGPVHGRGRAYANIVAKPDYSGQLVQGQTCRLDDFKVSAVFTMTLPKLGGNVKLSRDLTAR
jgi:predicted secreted Zn-dependent protease